MTAFLFGNAWWVIGLVLIAAAIAAPALLWRLRWPVAVCTAAAFALVFLLQVNALSQQLSDRNTADARRDATEQRHQADDQRNARDAEHRIASQIDEIATAYEQGKTDGKAQADAVRAGVADGTLQLRPQFKCPAVQRVPGAAPAAGGSDGEAPAQLSGAAQDFLVQLTAESDDVARQLSVAQDLLLVYQRQCSAVTP